MVEGGEERRWWEGRAFALALVLVSAIPLIVPEVPPLVDLPGHMARYRVELEIGQSEALKSFYNFHWSLIGNLGLDLLVIPLSKLIGLEAAVKLIVLSIPVMTTFGCLWIAREVHGKIPPTAAFALPFAYNYPFFFGFVNFALSMAFAFLAFGLWLRLARLGRLKTRAAVFILIAPLIWLTHTFGWGTLGVMAFSAELVRQYDKGRNLAVSAFRSGIHCLSIAPPLLLMLAWRSGSHVGGRTDDWFNWEKKWNYLTMALRDRWELFDLISLGLIGLLLLVVLFHRRLEYSRNLLASALFLAAVYVLLPRIVFGSAYADMRLVPYMIAVAVVGIRQRPSAGPRLTQFLAVTALAFFLVRSAATTVSVWLYDRDYDRELQALNHVPPGARLYSAVGRVCDDVWAMSRMEHMPGLATVRRRAFSNDQWSMPGAQLLSVRYQSSNRRYIGDPSQMVVPHPCPGEYWMPVNYALANLPRDSFDYVWLIRPPAHDPRLTAGLKPIWRSGSSVLYAVADRRPPLAAPEENP